MGKAGKGRAGGATSHRACAGLEPRNHETHARTMSKARVSLRINGAPPPPLLPSPHDACPCLRRHQTIQACTARCSIAVPTPDSRPPATANAHHRARAADSTRVTEHTRELIKGARKCRQMLTSKTPELKEAILGVASPNTSLAGNAGRHPRAVPPLARSPPHPPHLPRRPLAC